MGLFSDERTDTVRRIVETAKQNPNCSKQQIANHCDTSQSYVTQSLRRFGDPWDMGL